MIGEDWVDKVVEEIEDDPGEPRPGGAYTPGFIRAVILRHSPFKDGVAYMPVPRCDGCAWHSNSGLCMTLALPTAADFGCVRWEEKK